MEVEILNPVQPNKFDVQIGEKATDLLSRINIPADELETLKNETVSVLSNCTNPNIDLPQTTTNLVVGYVQSGKTMSFTLLSALASDNGFRIIIYFAGTKNNLLNQTTKRLRKDLINSGKNNNKYKLHENPTSEDERKICNELQMSTKPTILITVLKHYDHIANLASILNSSQIKRILGNKGVIIIDDEADQASLNGYALKNSKKEDTSDDWQEDEETATYRSILKLRGVIPNHTYIQYTATPQGPLLISILDLLSPKHHTVLTPGKGYTGGKTFFKEEKGLVIKIPDNEVFNTKRNNLSNCPQSLIKALQLHIIGVAIVVYYFQRESYLSMMIHADRDQDASQKFEKWTKNILDMWIDNFKAPDDDPGKIEILESFAETYKEAIREYQNHNEPYPTFDEILPFFSDVILDTDTQLIISRAKKQNETIEIDWDGFTSHILIGADMLNRGFTVEKLAVTYMPRYSIGKSTADTIQQRCRFFGYKKNYLWSCRVFLPESSILEYQEYVEHEEEMRKWLLENDDLSKVERLLLISPQLNPTRKNILSKDVVTKKLVGWHKMNAFQAIEPNKIVTKAFISKYENSFKLFQDYGTKDRNHRYVKLPVDEVIRFLSDFRFQNYPDTARKQATLRYLKYLSQKKDNPVTHVYVVQMAYEGEPRVRKFDVELQKIDNPFTGRSTSGTETYPGDEKIRWEDSLCIQIHNVKLNCDPSYINWNNKEAYTLAIYYPEELAISYVE